MGDRVTGRDGTPRDRMVLFVCADPLLPLAGGGASRIFMMVHHLRQIGLRVGLVAVDHGRRGNRLLAERVDELWVVGDGQREGRARRLWLFARRWAGRLFPGPLKVALRRLLQWGRRPRQDPSSRQSFILRKINLELCELAGRVAHRERPVAVISQFAWTARALDLAPAGTLKLLDTHDIQHLRRPNARAVGSDLPYHACTREEEIGELQRADVLLAIQRHDAKTLSELCPDREVIVVEHALDVRTRLHAPAGSQGIFFVGNLYGPNVLGLQNFLEQAWGHILAAAPAARLVVCGKVCEAFREPIEGVAFDGVVPDLLPYYADAAIVINPVPYGSGLKIKTIEALSFGKCLVGTSSAVLGLESPGELPFVVAEGPMEMAESIVELLHSPESRHALESRAWTYATERFAARNVYAALEEVLQDPHHCSGVRKPPLESQR